MNQGGPNGFAESAFQVLPCTNKHILFGPNPLNRTFQAFLLMERSRPEKENDRSFYAPPAVRPGRTHT